MSNSRKRGITGYHTGQAVTLGLALLALHFPAGAQPAGPPPTPIAFGQTVQGTLTSTDQLLPDGRPIDVYAFTVTTPGQPYFIKITSPEVPVESLLNSVSPEGSRIDLQLADVFTAGQTLGIFGVLNQPGRYEVDVSSSDPQQPTGPSGTASYTLSLTNAPPPAAPAPAAPAPAAPPRAAPYPRAQ